MTDVPPGEQTPESSQPSRSSDSRSLVDQAADLARTTFGVIRSIVFIAPLVFVVIVILLALMGPAIGNIFSNITSSL